MKLSLDNGISISWKDIESIDADSLTTIDVFNLEAEAILIPLYMNKIAQIMVELQDAVSRDKYRLSEVKDELYSQIAPTKTKAYMAGNGKTVVRQPDPQVINSEIYTKSEYITAKENLMRHERQLGSVTELYWSMKKKSDIVCILAQKRQIFADGMDTEVVEANLNNLLSKFNK